MKANKTTKFPDIFHPPSIPAKNLLDYKLLERQGFKPMDGEEAGWQNSGDTLVLAVPDFENAEKHPQIHEWINGTIQDCMRALAALKPDEFSFVPLTNVKGFANIMRLWWD